MSGGGHWGRRCRVRRVLEDHGVPYPRDGGALSRGAGTGAMCTGGPHVGGLGRA